MDKAKTAVDADLKLERGKLIAHAWGISVGRFKQYMARWCLTDESRKAAEALFAAYNLSPRLLDVMHRPDIPKNARGHYELTAHHAMEIYKHYVLELKIRQKPEAGSKGKRRPSRAGRLPLTGVDEEMLRAARQQRLKAAEEFGSVSIVTTSEPTAREWQRDGAEAGVLVTYPPDEYKAALPPASER